MQASVNIYQIAWRHIAEGIVTAVIALRILHGMGLHLFSSYILCYFPCLVVNFLQIRADAALLIALPSRK
jgi:hypothetical protein